MSGRPGGAAGGTLTQVAGLRVGHARDAEARTGCTVVVGPFRGAVEVRGLATGSRELDALSPLHVVPRCDAVLLTGGSAFGLAAADGVTRWLEERGAGFVTSAARVPIVPAAVLYDLAVGDPSVRPGPRMGYEACDAAGEGPVEEGAVGAGCGATVGKLAGVERAEPGGVGSWALPGPDGVVAALAVVNAFGDVVDASGEILAGCRRPDGSHLDSERALREGEVPSGFGADAEGAGARESTTLCVVATDAPLSSRGLQMVARQAFHALARRVRPAATPFDGDLVFALTTAVEEESVLDAHAEVLPVALRAEHALERAVERAVLTARDPGDP